jgi:hypothetical protein
MDCEIALIVLMDLAVGMIEFVPALEFGHEFQELEFRFHHYYHDFSYALQDLVHCHFLEIDVQIENRPDESL